MKTLSDLMHGDQKRTSINYTLDELKSTIRNFIPDTVLGEGSFGRVFKEGIDENTFKPSFPLR